jgi:hypothetical protein
MSEKLTAGPKTDRLVGERVMRWTVVYFDRLYNPRHSDEWSQDGPHKTPQECRHTAVAYWQDEEGYYPAEVEAWKPSYESAAAFDVIEELNRQGYMVSVDFCPTQERGPWYAVSALREDGEHCFKVEAIEADTSFPLAVCRVALALVVEK